MLSIKQMQKNLKYYRSYYKGEIDGLVGSKTKNAIKTFQQEMDLKTDGIYGALTDAALIKVVKKWQKKLGVEADGIIGAKTIEAVKIFQGSHSIKRTGVLNTVTLKALLKADSDSVDWKKVKYFKKTEFQCDCGGKFCDGYPAELDPDLIAVLEKARASFGKPMIITSGVRCKKRNAQLSGSIPNSRHLSGKAADVYFQGDAGNNEGLVKWFQKQSAVNYSYTGFGAVHVDVK